jgi:hypothetical protein
MREARAADILVADAIEAAKGSYFVGGSLASSLQGEPRATNDSTWSSSCRSAGSANSSPRSGRTSARTLGGCYIRRGAWHMDHELVPQVSQTAPPNAAKQTGTSNPYREAARRVAPADGSADEFGRARVRLYRALALVGGVVALLIGLGFVDAWFGRSADPVRNAPSHPQKVRPNE